MAVLAFFVSLLLGWFLTAIPVPFEFSHFWPLWVPSIMVAWVLIKPLEWSVMLAWLVGLSLDLMGGTPLSAQAFGLAMAVYVASLFRLRIQNLALPVQAVVVTALLCVYQMVQIWVRLLFGQNVEWMQVFAFVPGTLLVWPLLIWLVARLQHRLVH